MKTYLQDLNMKLMNVIKNPVKLKKIFIKNYEVGEIVEVEFENEGYELKIIENTDSLMNLKRSDPKIEIKIDKKSSFINVNIKNHISNFKCTNYVLLINKKNVTEFYLP